MPSLALVLGVIVGFLIFLPANFATYRFLVRFHPRRAKLIRIIAIAGNAMWLVLPFVLGQRTNPLMRFVRAFLAPPWFTWLMFILLYSGFLIVLTIAWLINRRRRTFVELGRWPSVIVLTLLCSMAVIGYVQALVPIRVERVPIRLASSVDGYRIALVSDLHVGLFTRPSRLETISRLIAAEKPDVVLIAGDFIDDDPAFIPKFLRGLDAIPRTTPILAVLGNHEIYGAPREVIRALSGSRVRLLVNEGVLMNDAIWLGGLSEFAAGNRRDPRHIPELAPDMKRTLAGRPAHATPIVFAHQPRAFALSREAGVPLTLAGHTHGGQFGFRPVGWSLAGVFLPYHMGLYQRDGFQLYVNTGTGYWVVPMRFGMTPEITIVELER